MIKYTTGDMFQSKAECLVNTVNCEGYMGKGVAYQFKVKFPNNNKAYVKEFDILPRLKPWDSLDSGSIIQPYRLKYSHSFQDLC